MSCVDDDNQGKELTVLWEYEVDAKVLGEEAWRNLGDKGFDKKEVFSAYYHTLKWNCVSAADPRIFHSPFRAGIQIHAYQLEPLRKSLLLPRVNLFIADDVGLGKTIEAGLIIREMLLRKKVHTLIVACPASVLLQWQEEMELRFGLGFEIMERAYLGRIRQERGYAVNPWSTHSRFIVSHALLRDEAYMSTLRDHLGGMLPQSMLILDEAHHAAPASGSKYAIDSQFTRARLSSYYIDPMNTELQAIPFKRADGSETTLAEYAGKVVLVVNVASKCGLTPQYDGLQALYAKYKDRGFVIAGFPANEFGSQEPGTDAEIQQFCRLNYGVDFPVHSKIVVKGPDKHPLYGYLTQFRSESAKPGGLKGALAAAKGMIRERMGGGTDGEITWNFEKFLLDRQGEVVARFAPDVKPEDPSLIKAIEAELAKTSA